MKTPDPNVARRRTAAKAALESLFGQPRAWTTRELHREVSAADLATVYRNVQAMLADGVIRQVCLPGAEARYERADAKHHAHRVCERCSAAECVPCPVRSQEEHHLEFHGLCAGCR
jgi:Fe2+ or Zn2+ uptake regulation protein